MNVLGISCYYHDASAALVRDGTLIAAAEEERFTRKKHDSRFPEEAVRFCLNEGKISAQDIDCVCFYEKPLRKLERLLAVGKRYGERSFANLGQQLPLLIHERLFFEEVLRELFGYQGAVKYCEHHLSHAAASYLISPFKEAAILTIDGVGEWDTTVQFVGRSDSITRLKEIRYPHSIGLLYSTFTAYLGFKVNNDEYKVMGLAPYGKPRFLDKLAEVITVYPDGSYRLNLDYFSFPYDMNRMYTDRMIELFGPPRVPESGFDQHYADIAASVQALTEETVVAMGMDLYKSCGEVPNVCLGGGVALNCVMNRVFMEKTPFKRASLQPAAGDGGGSVGAALYASLSEGAPRNFAQPTVCYLGPSFSDESIETLLRSQNAPFQKFSEAELCRRAAQLLERDCILGWFQGRMEFGPRALGNRSILANPRRAEMKDIINAKVKFREEFRPFAPAVPIEDAGTYFELAGESPHMLFTAAVHKDAREKIPAIVHVDGSARVQTVSQASNPRFHRLLREFGALTGVPVLVNTSFNIRGEPIVCTPEDAYRCFLNTEIDFLIMGDYLVEKLV